MRLTPIRKLIIFESNPDFADNTYWLFKYIVETKAFDGYKLVWFMNDMKKRRRTLCGAPITCVYHGEGNMLQKIRRVYYEYSASIIIDCNICVHKSREGQVRIYLGHGMGIKKVLSYICWVGDCDAFLTMGEGFHERYSQVTKSPLVPFGFPRNEVLTAISERENDKYIVWMPTYRQHKNREDMSIENKFPFGIPAIKTNDGLELVKKCLSECGMKLLLRPHPSQDLSVFKVEDGTEIVIADDRYLGAEGITLYELLASSSALITDYSSVYYDYLLTERPIGLNFEDAEEYAAEYGLWYDDVRTSLPGQLIYTAEEMADFIRKVASGEDEYLEKRRALVSSYGMEQRPSCELIVNFLKDAEKSKGAIK